MAEWKNCVIGDLCDTISDPYKINDKEVILINTSDVLEGDILNHTPVANENLKGQFKKTFQRDDILYSEIRPVNKRFAYIDFDCTKSYIVSTKLMVLRPRKDVVLPRFLYAVLKSQAVIDELQHLAETRSGTFPQITFSSELAPMKIMLPDFTTQKQIVSTLADIEDKIKLNTAINENLEQQVQAIFKSWFVDFEPFGGVMPDNWRIGSASEIIALHDSKRVPLSGAERGKMDKIYPYYGATTLMDYVDNYIFDGVFLLLGEDGTVIDTNGFPILQYVYGKFWVNNHAHVITGKHGYTVESLYLLFRLTNIKHIVTGAVQQKISQANLKKVPVIIPDIQTLEQFNTIIQPIFAAIRNYCDENKRLVVLRDTLLPKLMSGKIDVSNINI